MTLYLLFEQLEAGKLKLDTPLKVSEFAAEQSPTKLGLRPGSAILVEDAIKGLVTRSANDAAVVIAEAIARDEEDFADLMTKKARALGMLHTVYMNASGLPDDEQVTTARDQSILGRAIQERFPKYYKYFQTRSFSYRGQWIANHNRLLGRVEGVDGIKTGYTRASGFNLVTSVHRGNRYLVAVVLGGGSAGSRDARMRELISQKISVASTKRTATVLAELPQKPEARPEPKAEPRIAARIETKVAEVKPEPRIAVRPEPKVAEVKPEPKAESKDQHRFTVASASSSLIRLEQPATAKSQPGSSEPIRPVLVKTITVRPGKTQTAAAAPMTMSLPAAPPPAAAPVAPQAPAPIPPQVTAPAPVKTAAPVAPKVEALPAPVAPKVEALPAPVAPKIEALPAPVARPAPLAPSPARTAYAETPSSPAAAAPARVRPAVRSGWMIQVGAFTAEQEAKQRLSAVQSKASKMLDGTDPFTESVEKDHKTYYRARFAGLDKDKAEAACKALKRDGVECVTIKN
jgi:D-alanyl-D-alanine carboxypeptidase